MLIHETAPIYTRFHVFLRHMTIHFIFIHLFMDPHITLGENSQLIFLPNFNQIVAMI